jgi:hypothetical protein
MKNPNRYLIVSISFFVLFIFAVQAPLSGPDTHYSPTYSFVQPSCTDFTRWVINPGQFQNNGEICHGLGLIPAPVDRSVMPGNNPVRPWQSKIIAPKTGKISYQFL